MVLAQAGRGRSAESESTPDTRPELGAPFVDSCALALRPESEFKHVARYPTWDLEAVFGLIQGGLLNVA